MDMLITFVEVESFLMNPPSLVPCPDFTPLRALCHHMIEGLKQLSCPQSAIHGWAGLVMHPMMYALIKMVPFHVPNNPSNVPTLPSFAAPAAIKIAEHLFKRDKMYFTSYKNIYRACFKMLYDNIANKFKMSPDPHLIGWNSTMSIQDILHQLKLAYGCPSGHKLLHNDILFRLTFCATEAPKRLFWRIKQCQEIQVIADNPYTWMHLMTNAVQLLLASGIFPMREFENREATPNKTYNSLKLFVHGAYVPQLLDIQLGTTRQQVYVANQHNHNMYNVLEDSASVTDDNGSVATITQQTAANVTTGSTLGNMYTASMPMANPSPSPNNYAAVVAAINQLSANQTAMWLHMQNLSLHDNALPMHVANPAVVYNLPHTAAAY
jgi:hypothetical protein